MAIISNVIGSIGKKLYDVYKEKASNTTKKKTVNSTSNTANNTTVSNTSNRNNTYGTSMSDYPGIAEDTYKEVIRKASNGISLTDPSNKQNALLYSSVRDNLSRVPDAYSSYYDNVSKMLDTQKQQQDNAINLSVKQGTSRLNNQKENINQGYDDMARRAYIASMQSKKNLPQQLAASGISGGASETTNLGLETEYQNNLNTINQNRANDLTDIDNAILELQNTGDITKAENVLNKSQQLLEAYKQQIAEKQSYNQWNANYNLNRNQYDDSKVYQERAYKDTLKQQELENQRYADELNYNRQQQDIENTYTLMQNGLLDETSIANKLGITPELAKSYIDYITKSRATDLKRSEAEISNIYSTINNRNSSSGGSSSGSKSTLSYSTINNTVDDMLEQYKTADYGNMYKGNKLVSDYLIENVTKGNLNDDEMKAIMVSKNIPIETVATSLYKATDKNINAVNGFITNYFNDKIDDAYKQKIIDFATTH